METRQIAWRKIVVVFCVLFTIVGLVSGASAQVTTATISGIVKDTSDAVVPGATITITNTGTGISRVVSTDGQGRYYAPDLSIGSYELKASFPGFKEYVRSGITLTVGQSAAINVVMQVGTVTEQVTVNADAPLVDTKSSHVEGLVSSTQIRELPLNGRSFDQLALLQVGVKPFRQVLALANTSYATRISVSGARVDANNLIMDGIEINDWQRSGGGSASGMFLGVDAIQEFKVLTHNYSAEFGRSAGAIFNIITRSGTNSIHGSAFEFLRNDNFDARNFFDKDEKSTLARNQFGAYLGGPIIRDKAFFTAAYEGFRQRRGNPFINFVLSEQARLGIVPGNIITVSSRVKPYLRPEVMPLPNAGLLTGGLTGQYAFQFKTRATENYGMGRVDYRIDDNDSIFVRYTESRSNSHIPDSSGASPFFAIEVNYAAKSGVVNYMHIFGPTMVNTLVVGFKRSLPNGDWSQDPKFPADASFIPGKTFGKMTFNTANAFGISGPSAALTAFGQPGQTPGHWWQTGYQVGDHIVYTRGAHTIKAGGEYELLRDWLDNGTVMGGSYTFNGIANFLAAIPASFSAPLPWQDGSHDNFQNLGAVYLVDEIRVNPRVTVNLGLREEFITSPKDRRPGYTAALVNPLTDNEATLTPVFFELPLKNVSPRVGVAWDVFGDGKTSLRAGVGRYYNLIIGRDYGVGLQVAPAYRGTVSVQPPARVPQFPDEFLFQQAAGFPLYSSRVGGRSMLYYGYKTPAMIHYSVELQRELFSTGTLKVGYVGSRGTHLLTQYDSNTKIPTKLSDGRLLFSSGGQLENPKLNAIQARGTDGQSWYSGLQTEYRMRPTRGLELQLNYTWSSTMDNLSGNAPADTTGAPFLFMNTYDRNADYSLSALHTRHSMSLNYLYQIPSAPAEGVKRYIFNNWSVGGIASRSTGNPFTAIVGFCRSNVVPNCGADRPDLAPGASSNPVLGGPDKYFDRTAFRLPQLGTFGNLGRNTLTGPGFTSFDFSIYKIFPIAEAKTLQFRAEFFNIFNHANFDIPALAIFGSTGAYSENAGKITKTVTLGREIQFGLKFEF